VDAAGVNVERSRLVYVAINIMGEYKMKTFINLEDYILVLWRWGGWYRFRGVKVWFGGEFLGDSSYGGDDSCCGVEDEYSVEEGC
jgi:hypothetical protein